MEPGLELRIWQSGRECGAWFGVKPGLGRVGGNLELRTWQSGRECGAWFGSGLGRVGGNLELVSRIQMGSPNLI